MALLAPTILAVIYYGLLANDRYETEVQIIVRTASKPIVSGGFASILQITGISRSSDEAYSVQTYLSSRDMVRQLSARIGVREIFGKASALDVFARYPSLIYGASMEDLHGYLSWMITAKHFTATGITTLYVQAFAPEDALRLAQELLDLAERHVNAINQRIFDDGVRVAADELKHNEQRLLDAQTSLTKFRNSELMLDAASSSLIVTELIAKLSMEQTKVQAQIRETALGAAGNPMLASLNQRSTAIEEQITNERRKIARSDGLARKLAVYERLALEHEFAKNALSLSVTGLERARAEARRQQLYLVRVVEPVMADHPTMPERLRMIATILALNLIVALVAWLFWAGIKEHKGPQE